MDSRRLYRQDGYQKGFDDAKRTGGKIKKAYIDNFLNNETQSLFDADSLEFKKGWHEGFADGVRGVINKMVKNENVLMSHLYELEFR
jgi:hypothetical protein